MRSQFMGRCALATLLSAGVAGQASAQSYMETFSTPVHEEPSKTASAPKTKRAQHNKAKKAPSTKVAMAHPSDEPHEAHEGEHEAVAAKLPSQSVSDPVAAELASLRQEVAALRAAMPSEPVEVSYSESEISSMQEELSKVHAQKAALDVALEQGLPEESVGPSYAYLTRRSQELRQSLEAADASTQALEAPSKVSVGFGVEAASAYVFRGYNMFSTRGQAAQAAMIAPSVGIDFGDSGFSVGYWGAYQATSEGAAANVASGTGHEQDLILGYSRDVGDSASFTGGLVYYFYPFAEAASAGADNPSYLEPSASFGWSGPVDMGMTVTYMHAVQEALASSRYMHVRPSVTRGIDIGGAVASSLGASFGYKRYVTGPAVQNNSFDLQFDWSFDVAVGDQLTLSPALHAAWTNMSGVGAGDEYVIWFGLNSGVAL